MQSGDRGGQLTSGFPNLHAFPERPHGIGVDGAEFEPFHLVPEDEDWGRLYGRPVCLGKNPTTPKTRILATGNDAVRLLEHLYRPGADRALGPRVQALRQIMVQRTTSPTAAPLTLARFTKSQCHPCPARAQCTASREGTRTVGFPHENSATCNSASAPSSRHPSGRPATRSAPGRKEQSTSSPTDTACATAATEDRERPTSSTS